MRRIEPIRAVMLATLAAMVPCASCFSPGPDPASFANAKITVVFPREANPNGGGSPFVQSVAMDADALYVVAEPPSQGPPTYELWRAPKVGGALTKLVDAQPYTSLDVLLAVDATRAYWVDTNPTNSHCDVHAVAKTGGAPSVIASVDRCVRSGGGALEPMGLLVDGNALWLGVGGPHQVPWTSGTGGFNPEGGALVRIDLTKPSPANVTTLVDNLRLICASKSCVMQDATSLYAFALDASSTGPQTAQLQRIQKADGTQAVLASAPVANGDATNLPIAQAIDGTDLFWSAAVTNSGPTHGVLFHLPTSGGAPTMVTTFPDLVVADLTARGGSVFAALAQQGQKFDGNGRQHPFGLTGAALARATASGLVGTLGYDNGSFDALRIEADDAAVYLVGNLGIVRVERTALP